MITHIDEAHALALDLGPWKPKETTTTPGQQEAATYLLGNGGSALRVGVWECTAGRFTVIRKTTEICRLLRGKVVLRGTDGREQRVQPGDTFVLPKGWSGEWIIETVARKIFVVHAD